MTKDYWDLTDKLQTKIKLNILKGYLGAWAKIFANRNWCKGMYFVDCFAGRGKYHNQGAKNVIDGSPLIALNIAKIIKEKYGGRITCFFIEEDPAVFKDLQIFTEPFKTKIDFQSIKGDTNKEIYKVLDQIPDKWSMPIFFFVDPSGIDIKSDSIKAMLKKPNIKEFLITYIQKGVERSLGFGKKVLLDLPIQIRQKAMSNLKRVEDFFGVEWQELSGNQKENLKKYLNVFVDYNKTVPLKDQLKHKAIEILYNQGRNKYHLIFLSRNEVALKIIEDIFTNTTLKNTLFSGLSSLEKRKILRGKFDL